MRVHFYRFKHLRLQEELLHEEQDFPYWMTPDIFDWGVNSYCYWDGHWYLRALACKPRSFQTYVSITQLEARQVPKQIRTHHLLLS